MNLKNIISKLVGPLTLGLAITVFFSFLALMFYSKDADVVESSFSVKLIKILHQKSIDLRLQGRGPRKGSENVALLTVDERAVKEVGRWPWPRDVVAKAIDNTIKNGAKVIAMDVVWSEDSHRPEVHFAETLKASISTTPEIQDKMTQILQATDADRAFSEVIEKNAKHLVMGSFFNGSQSGNGYRSSCFNLVYEQSEAFSIWDNEQALLSSLDPHYNYVPEGIKDAYIQHLQMIASEIQGNEEEPKSRSERVALESKVQEKLFEFCAKDWLIKGKDPLFEALAEHWSTLTADEDKEDFPFSTFEEWVDHFRYTSLFSQVQETHSWVLNTPLISKGVKNTGFFNAILDSDGVIRRSQLLVQTGDHYMPSISFKAFLVANNYNAEVVFNRDESDFTKKGIRQINITNNDTGNVEFSIPITRDGTININFAGQRQMFPYVSLADMVTNSQDMVVEVKEYSKAEGRWIDTRKTVKKTEFLKDKVLILGATAIGIFDLRVTPFDENYPGAETHVNVIDNLMRRDFLRVHNEEGFRMLLVLVVSGILFTLMLGKLGSVSGLFTTLFLIGLTLVIDRFYFFDNGILVAVIFPILLYLTLYTAVTFYKYFTEERNKKELRSTFSKYVSPAIVDEILQDPTNIELGGTKKDISVFFSDIRGFTTISEKLDPKALSDLLNSYLTPMTDIVFENKGTLDKYMGDAVMAFFGAPISHSSHPKDACNAALDSLEKLVDLQKQYKEEGLPVIDIGIGINTGECSVGNMGSETVRNYTVMGDAVNLGSRLEGINKQYGTRIIISEFTYERVKNDFTCREIDVVRVKGKLLPVKIYELVGRGQLPQESYEHLGKFEEGYALYHSRE
ncbi:MAG: adenylate/guanylate cyclase domain-containing protein, partial [Bdellovibrionales bacterium]|nr:adenylate/guanylate cyclase domain-containing protein [Bdellovibrionales bacterium]